MKKSILTLFVILISQACSEEISSTKTAELELPTVPFNYNGDNNIATLGRVLFYDPQLSVNNGISCASCHKQSQAFADNVAFSKGFDNRDTERNSMPIQNLRQIFTFDQSNSSSSFAPFAGGGLFWDGRGEDHTLSLLLPIINHVEMGIPNLEYLTEKLSTVSYYPELFENAFGTEEIDAHKLGIALNEFVTNITSQDTKFDRWTRVGDQALSPKELLGKELFFGTYDCNACHQVQAPDGYLFAGTFSNIGLDQVYEDPGREGTTSNSFDNGRFKIPSLRNVLQTAPYMHDGRFETIEEVIEHYSSGVEKHPNLDTRLLDDNGDPIRFEIANQEITALKAFLSTLTDVDMLTDEKLSNPFVTK